jgi:hypothetical protein
MLKFSCRFVKMVLRFDLRNEAVFMLSKVQA